MAGQAKPMRASRISAGARTEGRERGRGRHPLAPFWALAGASLPCLVYDALIEIPEEFRTYEGVIVLAAVTLGVVLVGLARHCSHGLPDSDE
ncbi:MAG TPA: hypothetical protein VF336_00885 [Syntrophales bacterium]